MKTQQTLFLESQLNLVKFPKDAKTVFALDKSTPWVETLLRELNENATDKTPEAWLPETNLNLSLELIRKYKNETGEYLLVTGHITASYMTEDVKTLQTMKVDLDFPLKAVFLEESQLTKDEYADADDAWIDNDTYTIYSFKKNTVDMSEMIHEQLVLNQPAYPTLDTASQKESLDDIPEDMELEDDLDDDDEEMEGEPYDGPFDGKTRH